MIQHIQQLNISFGLLAMHITMDQDAQTCVVLGMITLDTTHVLQVAIGCASLVGRVTTVRKVSGYTLQYMSRILIIYYLFIYFT
jgi:predicted NUDIX family phosphoesterase